MKKPATKKEKLYLNKVASIGCIVCKIYLGVHTEPNVHHITEGMGMSQRNSHYNTLPLCKIHHQTGDGKDWCQGQYGYHHSPKEFEIRYGTQSELLLIVQKIIEQ